MRLEKGIKLINDLNADAMLLLNESNMHYFCGFSPSEGAVLILKDGTGYHFVDSRYSETARNHSKETGLNAVEIKSKFTEEAALICKKSNIKNIAFENETITLKAYNLYKNALKCNFIPIDDKLMRIRNVKEDDEIRFMKEANSIAEKSFEELLNHIKPGETEKELQAYFDYLMMKNGSDGTSFDTILLTGAHTSFPHGVPSEIKVQKGDFVLIDFGATFNGYHSDMTRTFAVSCATEKMKEMYSLVLDAQTAGINALKAGVKCSDFYYAAYNALQKKDMGKYFRHSLGHGVGLDIHEGFNGSPKSKDVYSSGNVTSVEPGIYLPNQFGIRIEDVCVVTQNGNEDISSTPKEFMII